MGKLSKIKNNQYETNDNIIYKTEQERKSKSLEILQNLNAFGATMTYEPVRQLMKLLSRYNNFGERIVVNIPFPEMERRIKGVLAIHKNEDTWIMLKHEKF